MDDDVAIKVSGVSKKFSRNLKSLMKYGLYDVGKSILGLNVKSEYLRKNEFWAVDDISFELHSGETLGIIGPNGSGKSTLLKMLNGIYMPDKGNIEIKGKVGALIEVGAGFHPLLTGRENIYVNGAILGMSKKEIDENFDDIVAFADIGDFMDSPVKNYSSGMYVRLGFAIAIHCKPDIILLDEILAVGDLGFQAKCLNKIGEIKKNGASIVIVTHNMHALSGYADTALIMQSGIVTYYGDASEAISRYNSLFSETDFDDSNDIQKVVTSTNEFEVLNVDFLPGRELNPGESLTIQIEYKAMVDLNNIVIDTIIYDERIKNRFYFQGTNYSFNKIINIKKGKGVLLIQIQNIPINNSNAFLALGICTEKKSKHLFWWENIRFKFKLIPEFLGDTYLNIIYEQKN